MVQLKVKLPLYDHNSCVESSCSEEDDLESLTFRQRKKSPVYIYNEMWFQAYKTLGFDCVHYLWRASCGDL